MRIPFLISAHASVSSSPCRMLAARFVHAASCRCDEYNPSRHPKAPMPPCSTAVSAHCQDLSACRAGCEPPAFGFGHDFRIGPGQRRLLRLPALPSAGLRSFSLRSSSLRPADGKAEEFSQWDRDTFFAFWGSSSALDIIMGGKVSQSHWHRGVLQWIDKATREDQSLRNVRFSRPCLATGLDVGSSPSELGKDTCATDG